MLSPAAGVFGTDCNVTDGWHPMIFLEKGIYSQSWEPHEISFKTKNEWRKASESAYPTNALGSIVLLLSLLNVLFNMFDVSYVSCNMLHWFEINKVNMLKKKKKQP